MAKGLFRILLDVRVDEAFVVPCALGAKVLLHLHESSARVALLCGEYR